MLITTTTSVAQNDLVSPLAGTLFDVVCVPPAPCIGRCEQLPAVLAGQFAVPHATGPGFSQPH